MVPSRQRCVYSLPCVRFSGCTALVCSAKPSCRFAPSHDFRLGLSRVGISHCAGGRCRRGCETAREPVRQSGSPQVIRCRWSHTIRSCASSNGLRLLIDTDNTAHANDSREQLRKCRRRYSPEWPVGFVRSCSEQRRGGNELRKTISEPSVSSLWLGRSSNPDGSRRNSPGHVHPCGISFRLQIDRIYAVERKCFARSHCGRGFTGIAVRFGCICANSRGQVRRETAGGRANQAKRIGSATDSMKFTPPLRTVQFYHRVLTCGTGLWPVQAPPARGRCHKSNSPERKHDVDTGRLITLGSRRQPLLGEKRCVTGGLHRRGSVFAGVAGSTREPIAAGAGVVPPDRACRTGAGSCQVSIGCDL